MRPDQETLLPEVSKVKQESRALERPPIYVSTHDHRRLCALISSKRSWLAEDVRAFLAQELDRAIVFAPEQIPPDVVTMNSRALFRRDVNEGLECRTLVYDDAAVIEPSICVFTFAGAALLGLAAGSRLPYDEGTGRRSILVVEQVPFQPEAHGRRYRHRTRQWSLP